MMKEAACSSRTLVLLYLAGSSTLKMAVIYSSETPVNFYLTTDVTSQKNLFWMRAANLKKELHKER
jgi:hypothetical protein